jgi:hypothetical protein
MEKPWPAFSGDLKLSKTIELEALMLDFRKRRAFINRESMFSAFNSVECATFSSFFLRKAGVE